MAATVTCSALLDVALPLDEAMPLFTAEGERRWVPGWNPRYPGARTSGAGAVFVTDDDGAPVFWVVVEQTERRVRYARTNPARAAGLVTVEAVDDGPRATQVRVSYDLTALSEDGAAWLDSFAAGYDDYIGEWGRLVATVSTRP